MPSIEILETIDSTHLYLKSKILLGVVAPDTFVLAKSQTQGKGTHGRSWSSPYGESFALSFILEKQELSADKIFVFFLAMLIYRLLLKHYGISVQIKWPNDIYYDGKKLGGILVEQVEDTILVGIGLNLNQASFSSDLSSTAISLYQIDQHTRDSEQVLHLFINLLYEELGYYKKDSYYFWEEIDKLWLYQNQKVEFVLPSQKKVVGILQGVRKDGALIIETTKSLEYFYAGTLRFVI